MCRQAGFHGADLRVISITTARSLLERTASAHQVEFHQSNEVKRVCTTYLQRSVYPQKIHFPLNPAVYFPEATTK